MRQINRCLNSKIAEICQQALLLEGLNSKLAAFLPESLREHCMVGSFTKGCLTLIASDQSWASLLRYELPNLRDELRAKAGLYQLSSIKIAIKTEELSIRMKKIKPIAISETARQSIIEQANHCEHGPLKDALLKLATVSSS